MIVWLILPCPCPGVMKKVEPLTAKFTCKYFVFISSQLAWVTFTCKLMHFVYIYKCPSCTLSELRIELKLKMISTKIFYISYKLMYIHRWYIWFKIWLRFIYNKRPTGLNGHLSIRDFTLTSCQKAHICISTAPS